MRDQDHNQTRANSVPPKIWFFMSICVFGERSFRCLPMQPIVIPSRSQTTFGEWNYRSRIREICTFSLAHLLRMCPVITQKLPGRGTAKISVSLAHFGFKPFLVHFISHKVKAIFMYIKVKVQNVHPNEKQQQWRQRLPGERKLKFLPFKQVQGELRK